MVEVKVLRDELTHDGFWCTMKSLFLKTNAKIWQLGEDVFQRFAHVCFNPAHKGGFRHSGDVIDEQIERAKEISQRMEDKAEANMEN